MQTIFGYIDECNFYKQYIMIMPLVFFKMYLVKHNIPDRIPYGYKTKICQAGSLFFALPKASNIVL